MSAGRRPHARAQPTQWLFHNQNFTDILIYSTINISNTPETNSYYYTTLYQEDGHVFECMLMYIIRFLWYACRLNNLIDTGIWSVIVIFDLTVRAFFFLFLKKTTIVFGVHILCHGGLTLKTCMKCVTKHSDQQFVNQTRCCPM